MLRDGDLVEPDRSDPARLRRNGWHTAADWVEAFAPVVFELVEVRLHKQAVTERARLDARLAAGKPVDRPQVLLLDDVPVYGRTLDLLPLPRARDAAPSAPGRRRRGPCVAGPVTRPLHG